MAHKGTPVTSVENTPVTSGKGRRSSKSGTRKSVQQIAPQPQDLSETGKSQSSDPKAEENAQKLNKGTEDKVDELKVIFMEEELKDLKKKLRDEKNRNVYLAQLLEQTQKQQVEAAQAAAAAPEAVPAVVKSATMPPAERDHVAVPLAQSATGPRYVAGSQMPFDVTVEPLLVHINPMVSRKPTLGECEIIIKNLQKLNDKQAHELTQLKSDLRDVLYSHKWTPDAYLLAKAYVAEDDAREQAEKERLPRIQMKPANKKVPEAGYHSRDRVQLPELRSKIGNTSVERRKRTQLLQKARTRREVLH